MTNDKTNDKLSNKINNLDNEILAIIEDNKFITIPEMAMQTNKSEPTIHRHLEKLISNNIIERVGSRKTGYWSKK